MLFSAPTGDESDVLLSTSIRVQFSRDVDATTIKGHVQSRLDGVSMRYSVDDPSAPSARKTQFYSMLGSRGIWHDGWKAVTTHPTLSG